MAVEHNSISKNAAWMFVGNIIYSACLWGMLAILTKLGSQEVVGRFALASATASPIVMFANLQLRSIFVSDIKNDFKYQEYYTLRITMLLLSLLAVVIIAANNFSTLQAAAIIIFATGRLIEGVSDIFYGYSQKKDRLDIVAQSMIAKGIISLGLFYISFKLFSSLSISLLSMVVGWSIPLLFLDIPRNRKLMFKSLDYSAICYHINIPRFRSLFWLALPMGLTMFFIQLRNSIPRLILESGFGEQDLGVFAAMAYLILIGNTIVMALSQSSIARLSRYYILGNGEAFRALVIRLVLIGVCLGVVGVLIAMIAGQQLLSFMYGPDYAENIKVFIVVMLAGGLTYVGSFLGAPATAMRKFKPQLAIHSINAATMLGFGLFIIPKAGMIGAAWTMVVGACIMVIGYSVIVVKGFCSLGLYLKGKKGDLK